MNTTHAKAVIIFNVLVSIKCCIQWHADDSLASHNFMAFPTIL